MEGFFIFCILAWVIGFWIYRSGKREGSRKGYNVGRNRARRRRR